MEFLDVSLKSLEKLALCHMRPITSLENVKMKILTSTVICPRIEGGWQVDGWI